MYAAPPCLSLSCSTQPWAPCMPLLLIAPFARGIAQHASPCRATTSSCSTRGTGCGRCTSTVTARSACHTTTHVAPRDVLLAVMRSPRLTRCPPIGHHWFSVFSRAVVAGGRDAAVRRRDITRAARTQGTRAHPIGPPPLCSVPNRLAAGGVCAHCSQHYAPAAAAFARAGDRPRRRRHVRLAQQS